MFYVYTYDTSTGKPKVSAIDSAALLQADGSVGLSANWAAGAYQIQVSVDPSGSNDLTRKSWVDAQIAALAGPFGAKNAFAGVANGSDPAGVSVGSRFLVVGAYSTYDVGDVIEQTSEVPEFTEVSKSDGDTYVAKASLTGSTVCTSDSSTIDDSEIAVWDVSTGKWVVVGSVIAIPDATAGSGGDVKGKVTADSDKGLGITSGVLEVKIDTNTLEFSSGNLAVKVSGITHNNLGGLDSGDYQHLTATQKTDLTDAGDSTLHYHAADRARAGHTGTQVASTISDFSEAAQDAAAAMLTSGSNTTIEFTYNDSGNALAAEVKDDSIVPAKLGTIVQSNNGLAQDGNGALAVDYDNTTIGIVNNKLAVLSSGQTLVEYTNNTGSQIDQYSVVSLSKTVAGEIVLANANDEDLADAEGIAIANIADEASGNILVKGKSTVLTDGVNFDLGRWVYVGGGAAAGKASKYATGSYTVVKLGKASGTNEVSIDKQYIG